MDDYFSGNLTYFTMGSRLSDISRNGNQQATVQQQAIYSFVVASAALWAMMCGFWEREYLSLLQTEVLFPRNSGV